MQLPSSRYNGLRDILRAPALPASTGAGPAALLLSGPAGWTRISPAASEVPAGRIVEAYFARGSYRPGERTALFVRGQPPAVFVRVFQIGPVPMLGLRRASTTSERSAPERLELGARPCGREGNGTSL